MSQPQIWKGVKPLSSQSKKKPTRDFSVKAKDFTGAETGFPIPIIFGTIKTAGMHMTPIFKLKSKKVKSGGK